MKIFFLALLSAASAFAQFIVHDPGNTAVNAAVRAGQVAHHVEVMHQWAAQLENLNRQLLQLQEQLAVQQRIREVIGDPSAAGAVTVLRTLGAHELAETFGETSAAARRLANAVESLQRTSDGIYRQLDDRTPLGASFTRNATLYRRYAAVERQADNLADAQRRATERLAILQADIAATLVQLRAASTQAEVDKLQAKLTALNGQLAHVDAQRRDESDKLRAQQILNENQAAKERQDLLEVQLADERQTLDAIGSWQASLKIAPTSYQRP
jgi:hypothetical protein